MTKQATISIMHEKKQLHLKPTGLFLYQGFQVIEAFDKNHAACYYLFFYKSSYLTGKAAAKIKRKSRLSSILQKGISLSSDHPYLSFLLRENRVQSLPAINPLWEKIQSKYKPLEAANILSVFDSFIKKEKIIKIMKDFALQYRREGQLFHTYQIIRQLVDLYPSNKWAQEMSKNLQYQPYQTLYHSDLSALMQKDPLYVEQYCYDRLEDEKSASILHQLLRKEDRQLEQLSLYSHCLIKDSPKDDLLYQQMLINYPPNIAVEEKADLLLYIANHRSSDHKALNKDLFALLKKLERYKDALLLLIKDKSSISNKQLPFLLEIFVHLDLEAYPEITQDLTLSLSSDVTAKEAQSLLDVLVPVLLKVNGLADVHQWLKPFYKQYPSIPILLRIKKMAAIQDDPDQMYSLGEMYYQLKQLKEAAECFSWELELNPTNIKTIKWLTKLYLEMGMIEESKSYQYMYHNLQKGS